MSEEQLKAFIAKVQADTSLQEQLKAEGADVVAIAKAAGFTITTEDPNSHLQTLSDELSGEELESVAGGKARLGCVWLSKTKVAISGGKARLKATSEWWIRRTDIKRNRH